MTLYCFWDRFGCQTQHCCLYLFGVSTFSKDREIFCKNQPPFPGPAEVENLISVSPVQFLSAVLQQKMSLLFWDFHSVGLRVTPDHQVHLRRPAGEKLWKLAAWLLPTFFSYSSQLLFSSVAICPVMFNLSSAHFASNLLYRSIHSLPFHFTLHLCILSQYMKT